MKKEASSLQELFAITNTTVAKAAARTEAHIDRRAGDTCETVAKTALRLKDHIDRRAGDTCETVAKAAVRVKGHVDKRATDIMDRSDANHAETRRVIRDACNDMVSPGVILFAIIMGLAASLATYFSERNAFFKPVAWDQATGAVTKFAPDNFMVWALTIVAFFVVFFIVAWITHALIKRFRR